MDGVVCEIEEKEKMEYLQKVNDAGVSNIEMECTALASLCHLCSVKCAVVCVALLDRLKGDQVLQVQRTPTYLDMMSLLHRNSTFLLPNNPY